MLMLMLFLFPFCVFCCPLFCIVSSSWSEQILGHELGSPGASSVETAAGETEGVKKEKEAEKVEKEEGDTAAPSPAPTPAPPASPFPAPAPKPPAVVEPPVSGEGA